MTDWTVLELHGVMDAAEKAARRVAAEYSKWVEFDDMLQEGYIHLASDHEHVRRLVNEDKLDWVRYELYRRLSDVADKEYRRRRLDVPRVEAVEP